MDDPRAEGAASLGKAVLGHRIPGAAAAACCPHTLPPPFDVQREGSGAAKVNVVDTWVVWFEERTVGESLEL